MNKSEKNNKKFTASMEVYGKQGHLYGLINCLLSVSAD